MEQLRGSVQDSSLHLRKREVRAHGLRVEAVRCTLIQLHPVARAIARNLFEPRLLLLRESENLRVLLGCDGLGGLVQLSQQRFHVPGGLDELVRRRYLGPIFETQLVSKLRARFKYLLQQILVGRVRAVVVCEIQAVAQIVAAGIGQHGTVVGLVGGNDDGAIGCGSVARDEVLR